MRLELHSVLIAAKARTSPRQTQAFQVRIPGLHTELLAGKFAKMSLVEIWAAFSFFNCLVPAAPILINQPLIRAGLYMRVFN